MLSPNWATFSAGMVDGMSGVQTGPGATLFTRIPRGPSSWAREAHMLAIPALVAAYGISVGLGMSEFTDDEPMIDPPGPMCGTAALARWKKALRLVARVRSQSSSGISSSDS